MVPVDSATVALPSPGNPLAQEIMSLYQEPDGTRRLLNYLLDNLAGAMKRSKSPSLWQSCEQDDYLLLFFFFLL